MRRTKIVAFVVVGLLTMAGVTAHVVWAQSTGTESVVAVLSKNRLVLTVAGQATTITADRISRHDKGYTLRGNFRVLGPNDQEYRGKDAEATVCEGDPGDGSRSKMLQLTTRNSLMRTISSQGTDGKPVTVTTSSNNDGEWVAMTMYLHPRTFYTNAPDKTK